MYTNPKGIRDHEIKIRLNEEEAQVVDALVSFLGKQRATFLREMAIEHIKELAAIQSLDTKKIS